MSPFPYVNDRARIHDAEGLIDEFGEHALTHAASRAAKSRDLGNVLHYCQWRQVERIIAALGQCGASQTHH